MDVITAIRTKRAVREFRDEPLPETVLNEILAAGSRAQSSKNTQPWQFVVVRDRDTLTKLSTVGDYLSHVAGAAACIVLVAANDEAWTYFDLGQSAAYLQLAAHALGVGSCLGAIYRPDEARSLLGVPAQMSVRALLSLGYPAPSHKPAVMGGRKKLPDVVHWEHWGSRS